MPETTLIQGNMEIRQIKLSNATIEYHQRGTGPTLLFLHGVAMSPTVFDKVVDELYVSFRCVVPSLPLGSHSIAMPADTDLSMEGLCRMMFEFMDKTDLRDVGLVGCDLGLAQVMAAKGNDRIGRLILCSQEAFDNFPPGLPGKMLHFAARIPGGLYVLVQGMRFSFMRRLPVSYGPLSKYPIPDEVLDAWIQPMLTRPEIRQDLIKYLTTTDLTSMSKAAESLASYDKPTLIIWSEEDYMMPFDHGKRLAKLIPNAKLTVIKDSYTLIVQDQPKILVEAIKEFYK